MNTDRLGFDDTLNMVLVAACALLAVGLQISTAMGYALDRGSRQANSDKQQRDIRMAAAAAGTASRTSAITVASRGP